MAMKDFDFKQFLLRRGELVGLGVAVLLAAILVLMGSRGFLAGSPQTTANSLKAKSQQASQAIENSTPPDDLQQVQAELLRSLDVEQIDPRRYELTANFVHKGTFDDTKRRNPEILSPRDFEVKMFRAPYLGFILSRDGRSISVVKGDDIKTGSINNFQQGSAKARFGGLGSMDSGGSGDGGGEMSMAPGQVAPGQAPGAAKREVREMEIDKLGNNPNAKFAEQIYPRYVAVVSAAFPFKQQLENFRKAIDRKATLATLVAAINAGQVPFQFETLEIQRRVTLPSGRIEHHNDQDEGWKSFDEQLKAFTDLMRLAPRYEEEDPRLRQYAMINKGLVMPRPALARGARHPGGETDIPSIREAIDNLDKAIKEKNRPVQTPQSSRFDKDRKIDPFDSSNPFGDQARDPNPPGGEAGFVPPKPAPLQPAGTDTKPQEDEPLVPEYVLVRFLDPTVKAGHAYEYRVRVKMRNPNYGKENLTAFGKLAKQEHLVSPEWAGTEGRPVKMPDNLYVYAVDEKPVGHDNRAPANKEKVAIQAHRWVPGNKEWSVANWIVLERALVHRGETVAREEPVDVPLWDYAQDADVLAASRRGSPSQTRVPIDFRMQSRESSWPAVLVDFDGGNVPAQKVSGRQVAGDQAATQLVILAPDGRLIARNSHDDSRDKERQEILETWRQWIRDAREGKRGTAAPKLFNEGGLPRGGPGKP